MPNPFVFIYFFHPNVWPSFKQRRSEPEPTKQSALAWLTTPASICDITIVIWLLHLRCCMPPSHFPSGLLHKCSSWARTGGEQFSIQLVNLSSTPCSSLAQSAVYHVILMLSVSDVLRGPTEHMKLVYRDGRETVEIEMQLYITNTCTFYCFFLSQPMWLPVQWLKRPRCQLITFFSPPLPLFLLSHLSVDLLNTWLLKLWKPSTRRPLSTISAVIFGALASSFTSCWAVTLPSWAAVEATVDGRTENLVKRVRYITDPVAHLRQKYHIHVQLNE